MIQEFRRIFSETHVNVDEVEDLMNAYQSRENDWNKFVFFDPHRYTRNLVDTGNGKFNVMILCWGEGQASSIHDHANAHCFVKALKGTLKETRFQWPDKDAKNEQPLKKKCDSYLSLDEVCYMSDEIGLHRMGNPTGSGPAVTLHVYSPPFNQCHTFDERTGLARSVSVTFWTEMGQKTTPRKLTAQVLTENTTGKDPSRLQRIDLRPGQNSIESLSKKPSLI